MKITFKKELTAKDRIDTDEIIQLLLKSRKIKDVEAFLHPPSPETIHLSDFGFAKEITKTMKLLKKIHADKQMIVVYTDYDADGITGGAVLWETLHLLGFNVMPYVPHRKLEGYGFSKIGIDNVKKKYDPALIISVDHGIAAVDQISYAKKQGLKVIITDHHTKQERIPTAAEAIFHIPALSGSGVAFFFAKMVYEAMKKNATNELVDHFKNDYVALASIGTVADLVPLIGPSRSIVKYGLEACSRTKRIGLRQVIEQAGIDGKKITPYEVGFIIAPRINAIGRLEHAIDALRLLCTVNYDKAFQLASKVGALNIERQDMVKKSVEQAITMVEKEGKVPKIIILQSDSWHEGIIGLIASRLTEMYFRPTIIMTKSDGFYKGSARSIPAFHMTNALTKVKENLLNVGGHSQAAGFSIAEKELPKFYKDIRKLAAAMLTDKDLERTIEADFKTPLLNITLNLAKKMEELEPYGIGNPKVSFLSEVKVLDAQKFGKTRDHLKIFVQDPGVRHIPLELIAFSGAQKFSDLSPDQFKTVVYQI